jgi:hypothetical protein
VSRRSSVRETAVSRASGARKLNYWGEFFWGKKEEEEKEKEKKSVNSELVIMRLVAV